MAKLDESLQKTNFYQILYLFLMFYFCYDSNVTILRHPGSTNYISLILTIILFCISVLKKKFIFNNKTFLLTMIFSFFTLTSGIIFDTNINNLISFILLYLIAFIVSCCFTKKEFINSFIISLAIICVLAIFCQYVLYPLFKNGIISAKLYTTERNMWPIADLFIGFSIYSVGLQRLYAFFREPGVFQVFLLIAMSFLLYSGNDIKNNKFIMIIFIVSIIATFSTAGIIFGALIILSYLLYNKKNNNLINFNKKSIFLIIIIFIIIMYILSSRESEFFDRISIMFGKLSNTTEGESFSVRYYSFFNVLKASLINPVLGMGWDYGLNYIINNLNQFGTADVTGTLLIIATVFGWPMCLICNYLYFKLIKDIQNTKQIVPLIINWIAIFLSINTQNILQNAFVWMLIFVPIFLKGGINENE